MGFLSFLSRMLGNGKRFVPLVGADPDVCGTGCCKGCKPVSAADSVRVRSSGRPSTTRVNRGTPVSSTAPSSSDPIPLSDPTNPASILMTMGLMDSTNNSPQPSSHDTHRSHGSCSGHNHSSSTDHGIHHGSHDHGSHDHGSSSYDGGSSGGDSGGCGGCGD
jgi:hypothetical protein